MPSTSRTLNQMNGRNTAADLMIEMPFILHTICPMILSTGPVCSIYLVVLYSAPLGQWMPQGFQTVCGASFPKVTVFDLCILTNSTGNVQ